jgi:hypothetical protein
VDARKRVEESRNWFERLAGQIPGYGGYKTKELAREADWLLRQAIADRLAQEVRALEELQRQAFDRRWLQVVGELGRSVQLLQTLADTIRTAPYGYAGLFDAVKVKEAQLDGAYEQDAALLDELERLSQAIGKAAAAQDLPTLEAALAEVKASVSAMENGWAKRMAILHGQSTA